MNKFIERIKLPSGDWQPELIPFDAYLTPESVGDLGYYHPSSGYFLAPFDFAPDLRVESIWVGAVVESFAAVTVRVSGATSGRPMYLAVSRHDDFRTYMLTQPVALDTSYDLAKFQIPNLPANRRFWVRAHDGSKFVDGPHGTFESPRTGAHSFSFGTASCANTGANTPVFDHIRELAESGDISFFIHTGDIHYLDIGVNDEALFQAGYDQVFAQSRQAAAWRSLPMFYMWDDHDYGPNDTDRDNPARPAAFAAYHRRVPHAPLTTAAVNGPIYHSWVRGRVRFIMTDQRSERAPKGAHPSTNPLQVVFTETQRDWFFAEMLAAKAAGQAICWASTKPWLAATEDGEDHWGGYASARAEVAAFIALHNLGPRMFIISGDMHAVAYDNGINNEWGGFPVCHAAPLFRFSSQKGGPYTQGPIPAAAVAPRQQYGILDVTDSGQSTISVRFRAIEVSLSGANVEWPLIDQSFDLTIN